MFLHHAIDVLYPLRMVITYVHLHAIPLVPLFLVSKLLVLPHASVHCYLLPPQPIVETFSAISFPK